MLKFDCYLPKASFHTKREMWPLEFHFWMQIADVEQHILQPEIRWSCAKTTPMLQTSAARIEHNLNI
jgi:hypothetical protein